MFSALLKRRVMEMPEAPQLKWLAALHRQWRMYDFSTASPSFQTLLITVLYSGNFEIA